MRTLHGVYERGQGLLQRRVLHVCQIAHWGSSQKRKFRADKIDNRLSESLRAEGKGASAGEDESCAISQ